MTIHKGNIEAFLLDYLEGNLDPLLTAELMAFMAENPGYEKWLPEYDGLLCLSGSPAFNDKPLLKKDFGDIPAIDQANFDEFCIGSAEGLLQDADMTRLADYIALHPEKQKDYDLYRRLKLQPDKSLVYTGKAGLKKPFRRAVPARFIYYALGAAACVVFLLMLTFHRPATQVFTATLPVDAPAKPRGDSFVSPPAGVIYPVAKARQTMKKHRSSVTQKAAETAEIIRSTEDAGLPVPAAREPIGKIKLNSRQPIPGMHPYRTAGNAGPDSKNNDDLLLSSTNEKEPSPLKFLGSVMKKLNFWKAAESAISGFNYLTEAQLSISKTTDQNGKLTRLSLATEQYVISGNKIK